MSDSALSHQSKLRQSKDLHNSDSKVGKSEPLSEKTNQSQFSKLTVNDEVYSSLFKSQEVIRNLKDQLNEKNNRLQEVAKELEYFKTAGTEPSRLVAQLEYAKKKLALTEQKNSKMELEVSQMRAEMSQLQSALDIANKVIQSLQSQLQE